VVLDAAGLLVFMLLAVLGLVVLVLV